MFALTASLALGAASGCGGGATDPVAVEPTLEISPAAIDTLFSFGDTVRLSTVARDGSGRVVTDAAIDFESSAMDVATVTADGILVSKGNGTATITARWGATSASTSVSVRQRLAGITLLPASVRLGVGRARAVTASPVDARGTAISGLPAPSYSSSDASIVAVSTTGVVSALRPGNAVVTASIVSPVDGPRSAPAEIAVATVHPAATVTMGSLTFSPITVDIDRGGTVTFVNESQIPHDVDFGVTALNIPTHDAGQNTRDFPDAGTFAYHCNLHGGMTGTIFVH